MSKAAAKRAPGAVATSAPPLPSRRNHVCVSTVAPAFVQLAARNALITNPRTITSLVSELHRTRFPAMTGVNILFTALLNALHIDKADRRSVELVVAAGIAMQGSVAERWHRYSGPARSSQEWIEWVSSWRGRCRRGQEAARAPCNPLIGKSPCACDHSEFAPAGFAGKQLCAFEPGIGRVRPLRIAMHGIGSIRAWNRGTACRRR